MPPEPNPKTVTQASKSGNLTATLVSLAGIAAIGAFATLISIVMRSAEPGVAETLKIATEEYVAGRPELAARLAERVVLPEEGEGVEQLEQERDFLIGAGIAAAADRSRDLSAWRLAMDKALPYLERAHAAGLPAGREADGYRLLGEALLSKGQFQAAAENIRRAIDIDPSRRLELGPLLVECELSADAIPADQALRSAERLLSWAPQEGAIHFETHLQVGRALAKQRQWPAAREHYREVMDRCLDEDLVQEAELLEAMNQVQEAMRLLDLSEAEGRVPANAILEAAIPALDDLSYAPDAARAARAHYWLAQAYRALGRTDDAILMASAARLHRPFGAVSIAAGVLELEMLAEQGSERELLQTARYVIREIRDPRLYDGRLVSLEQFKQRLSEASGQLRAAGEFQLAVDLARTLPPIIPVDDALMLEALAYLEWGEQTLQESRLADEDEADALAAQARARFRAAGDAASTAARERFTSDKYVSTVWTAISAYEQGRDFRRALEWLEDYLKYEARPMQPRGLIAKGRALLALGESLEALEPLKQCIIEHPRDSLRYEARLLAATADVEEGNWQEARELLNENLYDGTLAPESPVWRDSLDLLGRLLFRRAYQMHMELTNRVEAESLPEGEREKRFRENQRLLEDAIDRLEETAERERILVAEDKITVPFRRRSAIDRARAAQYKAARARQMAAHWPAIESEAPDLLDAARRKLKQTAEDHLQRSYRSFEALRNELSEAEENRSLLEPEQNMLRNCFLAVADLLQAMGRLEEAAEAYRGVSLRYTNEPPTLEAMLGQAQCMEALGRSREAGLIIRGAERALQRIPASWDGRFAETTRYNREQWERLLAWLAPETS